LHICITFIFIFMCETNGKTPLRLRFRFSHSSILQIKYIYQSNLNKKTKQILIVHIPGMKMWVFLWEFHKSANLKNLQILQSIAIRNMGGFVAVCTALEAGEIVLQN
jgi:hypothetical protein